MKITKQRLREHFCNTELEKFILKDILEDSKSYSGCFLQRVQGRLSDINHGCISGAVNNLIYNSDCLKFFVKFIEPAAFKLRNLFNLLLLFLFLDILLSTQQVLQNTFTGAVLHLDDLSNVNLYWLDVLGMLLGALFAWYALAKLKWHHKLVTFIGMSFIVLYIIMMYFLITPYTNIEKLYLPLIACGFGHVIVFIALTVYAQATAPFKNYFQVLCILGLIRTGIGSPLGDAIYTRALEAEMSIHSSLIVSIRELLGWSIVLGIFVLILIAVSRFNKHIQHPMPTLLRLYAIFKRTVR